LVSGLVKQPAEPAAGVDAVGGEPERVSHLLVSAFQMEKVSIIL
jgi:hypothetical protein